MKKEKFTVTGMTCSACSARVQKAVEKIEGTADVTVNLLTNSMQLQYDERETNPDAIIKAVAAAGYGASVKGRTAQQDAAGAGADPAKKTIADMKHRLIWSIAFLIPMMYISMHSMELAWIGIPVPEAVRAAFDGPENAVAFAFAQLLLLLPIMSLNRHY
ncbi:MAG: cation transporter, partial [Mitsuokella sp.]